VLTNTLCTCWLNIIEILPNARYALYQIGVRTSYVANYIVPNIGKEYLTGRKFVAFTNWEWFGQVSSALIFPLTRRKKICFTVPFQRISEGCGYALICFICARRKMRVDSLLRSVV